MYVRVYACVRTWGRSAAKMLRHRLAVFTQRGFFLLPDLRGVRAAGFASFRAPSDATSFAATLNPTLMLFAGEPH